MAPSDVSQLRPTPRLDPVSGAEAGEVAPASEQRNAVLVIGMHRSGTSAFTRVLNLCGARLPESLMPAGERNPRGYFESQRIYQLHEEMLAEAGSAWDDLSPLPSAWLDSTFAPVWVERMADAMRSEFGDSRLVALKDPRIARLIPFWLRVLERAEYQPSFLIPVRSPLDVAASLARAEGIAPAKSLLLWLGHLLAAERDTRGHRRSFVSYDGLIEDWRRIVARISDDLSIVFPRATVRAAAEIDAFLAAELRHHASAPNDVAERWSVPEWVKTAYEWAMNAAAGRPVRPTCSTHSARRSGLQRSLSARRWRLSKWRATRPQTRPVASSNAASSSRPRSKAFASSWWMQRVSRRMHARISRVATRRTRASSIG